MSSTSTHSSRVVSMASGTMVSRLTGLFRVLVLAWVLGFTPIADSFNLANTVPNMLFDLVLGGVAGATFIPVFVERLALDGERRAWKSISNVVTGAIIVLAGASLIAWFCAPWIIDGFTAFRDSKTTASLMVLAQQRAVATDLLRWFVPQIFFYGVVGVATSLLNIRNRFGVAAWVPVANNIVCIGVLIWFHLVDPTPMLSTPVSYTHLDVYKRQLLKSLTGRDTDSPVLLNGTPSPQSLRALKRAGIRDVVLPEADLSVAPSTTLYWGAPFHVAGAGGITALSTDGPLSTLFADTSIGAGRRAALTLGTLAFLHFEAPDAEAPRAVVIVAPISQTSVAILKDVLNGFASNPFITLATLTPSFADDLVATNGAPAARSMINPVVHTTWTSHNITSLSTLVVEVNSYAPALRSTNIGNDLTVAMEASEITGTPSARQSAINAATNALKGQLGNFSVDPSTITLAGSGTSIPITLTNHAPYTVMADVHLVTNQITFPKGDDVPVSLNAPTKSVRVATSSHTGSSLTLQVIVTTPNNRLVLARAAIQVRIAGTSIVGYFLTIASLLVLAYWWLRTVRKRPKGRHAR